MKLLILAQTPPPLHGQSLMVRTLCDGLRDTAPEMEVHHVNLPLSAHTADIGRWRLGKLGVMWHAIRQTRRILRRHGPMTLYYVPAPGKRSALYRDWLLMFCCRGRAERLVLHWHATGLGRWLQDHATAFERALTRRALGRADLSLVLGEALRADAAMLHPIRTEVLRNGIEDPCTTWQRRPPTPTPLNVLFISRCSRAKGVLIALAGVAEAHRRRPGSVRLTVAGDFEDEATARAFNDIVRRSGAPVEHVGFAGDEAKHNLFSFADVMVFPSRYEHEAHPLVVIEALAHDLPVIVSNWRAVAENLPPDHTYVVKLDRDTPHAIADALEQVAATPRPDGAARQHFLNHYHRDRFIQGFTHALDT
ncbi:glycosyltransferase family 4 protein [Synoicihabitans lomoniglobus]|uniref:Glycosyltransferase family 4 protein n=1 Tax=Synoicihabitans lomoniglobus TaxID=2909285 RepID=A0AAE9ZXE2_9BACT|nr:glycosyltransferase family 4 protein [Opitutaceae bacterium LMO-M01]WED65261.1 glycosyltransferase family 4 protein [Opitutaceae bacterium LMO-M01]